MHRRKLSILKRVLGPCNKSGKEYLFACPRCDHHKNKFSVNLDKDVYKCWVCEYKGHKLGRVVRRYGTIADRYEWEEINPVDIPIDIKEYFEDFYDKEEIKIRVDLPEQFETLSEKKNSSEYKTAINYLYSRGLSDLDILYWKIGYCPSGPYGGRVIIPSFDNKGSVNYFVGRAYKDFLYNYKNPKVNKQQIIFNELYIDWTKDLTLVEGVFDAIKAENAVPILGSFLNKNSKLFQEIVRHDTPIFLALDKDALDKEFKLIELLLRYEIEIYNIDTSMIPTDIGDLTKQEFLDLKNSAMLMTSTELLRQKMRNVF